MKSWLLFTSLFLTVLVHGQSPIIYIHDLENGTLDSIVSSPADTNLSFSNTNYYSGSYSSSIAPLSSSFPTSNVFPQSEFALKRKVSLDYSTEDFPIRAAVRIFGVTDGDLIGRCSGSMISRKHVLTAAHCHFGVGLNDLSLDSFSVCPAYDNGLEHPVFGCVEVSKIYHIKDWTLNGEDFAVLELKESIGYETGWLGIGFEEDSTVIANRMHYKFSYPAAYEPIFDSTVYNGDTLFYNYGKINYITPTKLGVMGGFGIPGESGSPILHVENDQEYTVYGVLSLASNLSHGRINNWIYHTLFSIIEDDLNVGPPIQTNSHILYPNPARNIITIKGDGPVSVLSIENSIGQRVSDWHQSTNQINIQQLVPGMYFVHLETQQGILSLRFVKQ